MALPFAAATAIVNGFPFAPRGDTELLAILHLPIALWIVIGVAHAGGDWSSHARRMDFVRFSGELAVFYVLTAAGGGVLMGVTQAMFSAIGLNTEPLLAGWILPCGALGAVIVGAWLVEIKRNVVEHVAPLLTRVFTPLLTIVLLTFLSTMIWTGRGISVERGVLIGFDLLLVMVLGLLLYAVTARHADGPPNAFDALQLLLIVSALLVDALALAAIAARISGFGFTPNRVAALGENLILFVNLGWSAWLYLRYLRAQCEFSALQRWQAAYLPVYAA